MIMSFNSFGNSIQEKLDRMSGYLEIICSKLVEITDNHSARLKTLESNSFNQQVLGKLDTLIEIGRQRQDSSPSQKAPRSNSPNEPQEIQQGNDLLSDRINQQLKLEASATSLPANAIKQQQQQFRRTISYQLPTTSMQNLNTSNTMESTLDFNSVIGTSTTSLRPEQTSSTSPSTYKSVNWIKNISENSEEMEAFKYFDLHIKKNLGKLLNRLTEQCYKEYSEGRISYEDMKIKFCWTVMEDTLETRKAFLSSSPNLTNVYKACKQRFPQFMVLNNQIHRLLDFLIQKYPPSRKKPVDTDLSQRIVEVNRHNQLCYDMLRNADFGFRPTPDRDYTHLIKMWVNKLIIQTRKQMPTFKSTLKNIFNKHKDSIEQGDTLPDVQYLFSSKISDACKLYSTSEIDIPGLGAKGPEILRILLKWLDQLLDTASNKNNKIIGNQVGFKSLCKNYSFNLTEKRKEILAEHLEKAYQERVSKKLADRDVATSSIMRDLFSLTLSGHIDTVFDEKEVAVSKMCLSLNDCVQAQVILMLNFILKELNAIPDNYEGDILESHIDLVSFTVMDLLRSRCIGPKQQIYRIYNEIMAPNDVFEVIRVKNKLNQTTKDILINLKLKNSFLICQVQLSLGKNSEQINDHFSHFLYQLNRTRFPVIFECANQIVSLDPRINYFRNPKNEIQFKSLNSEQISEIEKATVIRNQGVYCCSYHPQTLMKLVKNSTPFTCSSCRTFIKACTYTLEFLRCTECHLSFCPKCLLQRSRPYFKQYLCRYIDVDRMQDFFQKGPYFIKFSERNDKQFTNLVSTTLKNKVSEYLLLGWIDAQGFKGKMVKMHRDRVVKAFSTIPEISCVEYVMKGATVLNTVLIPKTIEIVSLQQIKYFQKFLFSMEWAQIEQIFQKKGINRVKAILNRASKSAFIIDIEETQQQLNEVHNFKQIIRLIEAQSSNTDIKLQLTAKGLTDLKALDKIKEPQKVKILNLWDNKLTQTNALARYPQLQQLLLINNKVESIRGLLGLKKLQNLSLQKNCLQGNLPQLDLPNLKVLDLSENKLKSANNLFTSELPALVQLRLEKNELNTLPVLNCPNLQIFFFQFNEIPDLDNLVDSCLPSLRMLHGANNLIKSAIPKLSFPCLTHMILNNNQIPSVANLEFCYMPKLEYLGLQGNMHIATNLPSLDLPAALKVDISYNKLTSLASTHNMNDIKELNLSHNCLTKLPLLHLPGLVLLNVENNKITGMTEVQLSKLPKLQTLNLKSNYIQGTLPCLRMFELKTLNLSHNQIVDISNLHECKLPHLQVLDLSHNLIQGRVPVLFMDNLKELLLDMNSLEGLDCVNQPQLIPKITVISLQGNHRQFEFADNLRKFLKDCNQNQRNGEGLKGFLQKRALLHQYK